MPSWVTVIFNDEAGNPDGTHQKHTFTRPELKAKQLETLAFFKTKMTKDIHNYNFELVSEVGELERDLGSRADNIVFVEAVVRQDGKGSFSPIVTQPLSKTVKGKDMTQSLESLEHIFAKDPDSSSLSFPIPRLGFKKWFKLKWCTVGHIVCFRRDEPFAASFGPENRDFLSAFTLYHETGHALIKEGDKVDNDHPFQENAGDAYAAIRCFQKFGPAAAQPISLVSWHRALYANLGETSHMTTLVLDKIIADSAHNDFSKLTSDETIELARAYARAWTPAAPLLSEARNLLKNSKEPERLLCTTNLSSASSKLAFYISAKFFQPLLHRDEVIIETARATPWKLTDEQKQKYTASIQSSAAGMDLRDIFNAEAAKPKHALPVMEALKVFLPQDQQQFRVNLGSGSR